MLRRCKVKVSFDMYRVKDPDGNPVNIFLETFEKTVEYEEEPYKNRKEAIEIDGTLEEWCEKVGKAIALDLAAKWVGADVPDDLDIKKIRGETFEARNIKGDAYDCEESEVCPEDVLDRIERLEDLIRDSDRSIKGYEDLIADILAIREEDRTVEDSEKLLRLDGYISVEKENIRRFMGEIDRLRKTWDCPELE